MSRDSVNINSEFWVGIVEDNSNDPLKIGRCRVRIIGTHDFNSVQVPTASLPWVQCVQPVTSNSFTVPNVNDWVIGHYMDGSQKQMPIITGILPGMVNKSTYVRLTGREQREYLKKLQAQATPLIEPEPKIGQPTIAASARGDIANTSYMVTNSRRGHACEAAMFVRRTMAQAKVEAIGLVRKIREAIVKALQSLGITPSFSGIKSTFLKLKETLEEINDFLNNVILEADKLVQIVKEIRAVLDYILSLPQKLLAMFQDCLNQIYIELSRGAFEVFTGAVLETGLPDVDISEVVGVLNETRELVTNAITIATTPAQLVDALLSPSGMTPEEQKKLAKEIFPNVVEYDANNFQGL